jgi:hypothetical protein
MRRARADVSRSAATACYAPGTTLANSDSTALDDPKVSLGRLALVQLQATADEIEKVGDALRRRAQNPNARMFPRRVLSYVGKIEVERDEDPALSLAGREHRRVGLTTKPLVQRTFDVMTGVSKRRHCIAWQVLI